MVKVQCITDYYDKQLSKDVTPKDEPFVVSSERAEQLVNANVCKIVEVIPEEIKEPVEETKPKKRTKKNK